VASPRELGDRQRRRVRREDHVVRADLVETRVELLLDDGIFGDRLEDDVGRLELLELGGAPHAGETLVVVLPADPLLLEETTQSLLEPDEASIDRVLRAVPEQNLLAVLCGDLSNPDPHHARSQKTDDLH
jgi:hypothetical protein